MTYLDAQRRRVGELRAADEHDPRLAEELVALAELEPVFAHRHAAVQAILRDAAARLSADATSPAVASVQGRLLVRLAATQIAEARFDDASETLTRAMTLLPADHSGRIEASALAVRAATRRGDPQAAANMVPALTAFLGATPSTPAERRAVLLVALAVAELMFEDDRDRDEATAMFKDVLDGVADDDRYLDLQFTCHQALAAADLLAASERTAHHLRAVVKLTKSADAVADEVHARIALAGVLTEIGDLAPLEEAGRHLQIARDRALEAGLDDLHMLTLIGQAGYLSRRGRVHGALDRCLEIARSAVVKQDVHRYVGAVVLMSTIYEVRGDLPSATRALIEAEHGLGAQLGDEVARSLFRPQLKQLADRIGRERFVELLAEIRAADEAEVPAV